MSLADEILFFVSLSSCLYISVGVLCRIRHGNIAKTWATIYAVILGDALWTMLDLTRGQASLRDVTILITMSAYIFLTQNAWASGVPAIAQKKRT